MSDSSNKPNLYRILMLYLLPALIVTQFLINSIIIKILFAYPNQIYARMMKGENILFNALMKYISWGSMFSKYCYNSYVCK